MPLATTVIVAVAELKALTEVAEGSVVMVGLGLTVYPDGLVAVPPAVVTVTLPAVRPDGVTAVIEVADTTVYDVAAVPLNATALAPVKFVPVIVTVCPPAEHRAVGIKEVMVGVGGASTVNI